METTKYSRTGKMNFELYIQIHTQAHNDLAQIEEAVLEEEKDRKFLNGITDSKLKQFRPVVTSNLV
jgi:hypothetical protein